MNDHLFIILVLLMAPLVGAWWRVGAGRSAHRLRCDCERGGASASSCQRILWAYRISGVHPDRLAVQQDLYEQVPGSNNSARASARYALVWRPKFLAGLSLTRCVSLAARMARVPPRVAYEHRKQDAEFAQQWQEAEAEAIELLHSNRCNTERAKRSNQAGAKQVCSGGR